MLIQVLQNKAEEDEKKMMQLEADLKAARTAAEDADASYEEISKKLVQCEADLERAEERAETGQSSILPMIALINPLLEQGRHISWSWRRS